MGSRNNLFGANTDILNKVSLSTAKLILHGRTNDSLSLIGQTEHSSLTVRYTRKSTCSQATRAALPQGD